MIRLILRIFALASVLVTLQAQEILLHASKATVHGATLRYEPQTNKNCLGYWTNPDDGAEWKFIVERPGVYDLEVWQGCGKGNGGSDVRVEVAAQNFDFVVDETGHFQSFLPRRLGRIHFWKAGEFSLAIKPQNKKAAAVMDIRQVKLMREPMRHDLKGDSTNKIANLVANARRIVFLGDSITYGGDYIEFFEAFVRKQYPRAELDIIDLGLPSETVSGLSEPGHAGGAFPRPDLHERLDRVLEKTRPDLIFACYGMNDGIYYPFAEERFEKFREGIAKLRAKAAAVGAAVIHLTPPTFDATALKGRTLPAGLAEYRQPFEGYNEVLDRYSEWLVAQRTNGWDVIDIHSKMNLELAARRDSDPQFKFANDGVHPGRDGHWVIAEALIDAAFSHVTVLDAIEERPEILALVQQRQRLRKDAWLMHVGHQRPGMNKGKQIEDAEREADELALKLARTTDPQLPGKRILWNGFETASFNFRDKPMRVLIPRNTDPAPAWMDGRKTNRPWTLSGDLDAQASRAAGRGSFVIVASGPDALTVAGDLAAQYGLKNGEPKFPSPLDESGRPLIRKLGTVDSDLVETTPIVLSNRLWRFEWVRAGYWDNKRKTNYFRFRDPNTGEITDAFADGHEFGSAFINDGVVYVTGTLRPGEVNIFTSRDLKNWEKSNAIPSGKYSIFNTSICKAADDFGLMFEIDKPADEAGVPFTARFAKSKDLRTWTMTPPDCNYAKDRYTAPHSLRWLDGWFYNFYLEAHNGYEMRVVRSRDLIQWHPSSFNPVLKASPEDRRIANPKMPDVHRTRIANAINLNNSDIDFCELNGQLRITYSWGNQQGIEHLAEAIYDGSEPEFLRAWFPE
jgi:lysophospholipase L1-like esterase